MKRLLTVICVFFFLVINVHGQDKFAYGFKGGLSVVDLKQDVVFYLLPDIDFRLSYHIGGLVVYKIDKRKAVQSGLFFSSQGGSRDLDFTDSTGATYVTERPRFVYNYINVPILFKYKLVKGLSLKTGPQIGFLVYGKIKNSNRSILGDILSVSTDIDVKDQLKLMDFSWSFETGYEFNSGILIDLSYNLGLSDVNKGSNESKVKNSVFQLSLGYKF